jgi:hypothetical protein
LRQVPLSLRQAVQRIGSMRRLPQHGERLGAQALHAPGLCLVAAVEAHRLIRADRPPRAMMLVDGAQTGALCDHPFAGARIDR